MSLQPNGKRYTLEEITPIAKALIDELRPYTDRIEIAGSIRRQKPLVNDIEILYIPKYETRDDTAFDLFSTPIKTKVDLLDEYLKANIDKDFAYRLNKNGTPAYGDKNKLLVYKGTPLDVFTSDYHNWAMLMLIRTGGWQLNAIIATLAITKGLRLKHYEGGFTDKRNKLWKCPTEEMVFSTLGMPYLTPHERTDPVTIYKEKFGIDYSMYVKDPQPKS